MKAFHFRLGQALRWRAAQLDLEKSRTAAAAKRLTDVRAAALALRADLDSAGSQLGSVSDGATLEILDAWTEKTRRRIVELERLTREAEKNLSVQTGLMIEARRRHDLIGNLKETAQTEWRLEFGRELEAFAGETFLGRLQSKKRARSSGG